MSYKPKINKEQVEVVIMTTQEKIEGSLFILAGTRPLDMLNSQQENFVAISNAKVYSSSDHRLLFESDFLMLNKTQIVFIAEDYRIPR